MQQVSSAVTEIRMNFREVPLRRRLIEQFLPDRQEFFEEALGIRQFPAITLISIFRRHWKLRQWSIRFANRLE
jgi:hypothetical protein